MKFLKLIDIAKKQNFKNHLKVIFVGDASNPTYT